ncbi:hypothetical protein HDU96_007987 [Phlyctochytrium bullatum]|nr:hypothetical protein HDU96_007987 [Phlyctochytrium bullatum]
MLDYPSFPIELLHNVLIRLHPNDLPTLAAANRHLRFALPAVIDHAFATRHLAAIGCNVSACSRISPLQEGLLKDIKFDHPVLFMHAVAAVTMCGVSVDSCEHVWGLGWRLQDAKAEAKPGGKEIWAARVRVVRTAVREEYWPSQHTDRPAHMDSAFFLAAAMGSLDLLNDLRSRFPDAVADGPQTDPMRAFLWSCASFGFADGLKLVPHNHPVLNMRNGNQRTLLEEASFYSRHNVIQVLLDLGAAVNPPGITGADPKQGQPPLWCALLGTAPDRLETIKLLLTHGARHDLTFKSMTPLMFVVSSQWHDLMRLLLSFGADPNPPNVTWSTALELAAGRNDIVGSRALLDAGARITPLTLRQACKFADAETVAVLLEHGAEAAHPSHMPPLLHETLFMRCRSVEATEITRLLLKHGAPVDGIDNHGRTPLHMALASGYVDAAVVLLDAGADPTRRSRVGRTAFYFVAEAPSWHSDMEALLDRLLEMGVELNASDEWGRTALHTASVQGKTEYIEWLLARDGINLGLVDETGKGWVELALSNQVYMRKWLKDNSSKLIALGVDMSALTSNVTSF